MKAPRRVLRVPHHGMRERVAGTRLRFNLLSRARAFEEKGCAHHKAATHERPKRAKLRGGTVYALMRADLFATQKPLSDVSPQSGGCLKDAGSRRSSFGSAASGIGECQRLIEPVGSALSAARSALALRSQRACSRRAERPRHLDRLPEKGRERHWRGRVHGTYGALFLRF